MPNRQNVAKLSKTELLIAMPTYNHVIKCWTVLPNFSLFAGAPALSLSAWPVDFGVFGATTSHSMTGRVHSILPVFLMMLQAHSPPCSTTLGVLPQGSRCQWPTPFLFFSFDSCLFSFDLHFVFFFKILVDDVGEDEQLFLHHPHTDSGLIYFFLILPILDLFHVPRRNRHARLQVLTSSRGVMWKKLFL